jgi:predicted dehydrogenase
MTATPQASGPLTLGILGAANIARQFTAALRGNEAVHVAAIASRTDATARAFAESNGLERWFATYEALLADPSLEAVYIPLPNHLHAEWAIKAANAGKHVLCEKPLCMNRAEGLAMFAAARANGVVLLEAYPYKFQPQTAALRQLLDGGAIGTVRTMQASFGFTVLNPDVNIRMKPEVGGGALLDAGSYPVSIVRLVMGERPLRVTATPVWAATGVDISMMATLEFANQRYAQVSCAMNVANHRRAVIMGTAGTIETEYINHPSAAVPSQLRIRRGIANTIPFEDVPSADGSGFRYEAEAFAALVRKPDPAALAAEAAFSIDIAATLEAIAQSARSGEPVSLPR